MRFFAKLFVVLSAPAALTAAAYARQDRPELSAGQWVESADKTLVITYFRQRTPEDERDDIIGLLLINHSDAPKQARVQCWDMTRHVLDGSSAFRFELDLQPRERRQLFVQNEVIAGFIGVRCYFEDQGRDGFRKSIMGGMEGTPPTRLPQPAEDRPIKIKPPPDPAIDWDLSDDVPD